MAYELNEIQKLIAQNYAGGDFDYVQDFAAECADEGEFMERLRELGDSVFCVMMAEASPEGYVDGPSAEEVVKRMHRAAEDFTDIANEIEAALCASPAPAPST